MIETSVAYKAVDELRGYASGSNGEDACDILQQFIDDVHHLLMHNNVKPVAALFKPPKKGN